MGKRVAVLAGCNYPGTYCQLRGCINDAKSMKDLLIRRFDFKPNDITVLTDEKGNPSEMQPTGANIKDRLNHMATYCTGPDDLLVFFFSGHGTRGNFSGQSNDEDEEAIQPTDHNLITRYDFRYLVDKLKNATFMFISDSCHSGGLIDKEELQIRGLQFRKPSTKDADINPKGIEIEKLKKILGIGPETKVSDHMKRLFGEKASLCFNPMFKASLKKIEKDKGILISACRSEEFAFDLRAGVGSYIEPHGAFTVSLLSVLQDHPNPISNWEVVMRVRKLVKTLLTNHKQRPCLYCSADNLTAVFLFQKSLALPSFTLPNYGYSSPSPYIDIASYAHNVAGPKDKFDHYNHSISF